MFDFSNRETVKNILLVVVILAAIAFVAMNKVSGDSFFKIVDRVTAQYFGATDQKTETKIQESQILELSQ